MVDLPQDQEPRQTPTSDIPVSDQPQAPFPLKEEATPPSEEGLKTKLSSLGIKPSEPKKPPKKKKIILAVLSLLLILASIPAAVYLVQQRQEIRKEAEVPLPSPVIVKSVAGQGVWKQIAHDGYPGCWSASQCPLVLYSTADGWTSLGLDDSSWSSKNFTVDSGWWQRSDLAWICKNTYFTSGPQIISIVDDRDTIFPNKNGVTGLHRKGFQLTIPDGYQIANAELRMFSDNKTAAYINGGLIISNLEACYSANVDPQLLKQGENVLAIQLSNDHVNEADNPIGMQYELTINFTPIPTTPIPTPTPTPTSNPCPPPNQCVSAWQCPPEYWLEEYSCLGRDAVCCAPIPPFSCIKLEGSPDPASLKPGEETTLTCSGSSDPTAPIHHFDFRISIDGGEPVDLGAAPATGTGGEYQAQKNYTIPDYGCYKIECRSCVSEDSSNCTAWGQAVKTLSTE